MLRMTDTDPIVIDVGGSVTDVVVVVDDPVLTESPPSDSMTILPLMR